MSERPYRVYRGGQRGGSPDDPELALPGFAAGPATDSVDAPGQAERRGPIVLPPGGSAPRSPQTAPAP
ncbi:MAG: hypothetical protein QOE98_54, partial [Gaiellaceae bacterium]|nr:hypothetical protein [Gaiellaceae bacterium]